MALNQPHFQWSPKALGGLVLSSSSLRIMEHLYIFHITDYLVLLRQGRQLTPGENVVASVVFPDSENSEK